jgi:hypothetical protein
MDISQWFSPFWCIVASVSHREAIDRLHLNIRRVVVPLGFLELDLVNHFVNLEKKNRRTRDIEDARGYTAHQQMNKKIAPIPTLRETLAICRSTIPTTAISEPSTTEKLSASTKAASASASAPEPRTL